MNNYMKKFSLFYAQFIAIFLIVILLSLQLSFIFNSDLLRNYSLIIAIVISSIGSMNGISKKNIILLGVVFIVSGIYSYYLFDKAGDGRWYHQDTMILIRHLWNPLTDYYNVNLSDKYIFSKTYPIANEMLATSFYLIFNNIQIGKIINTLLSLYLFSIMYLFLSALSELNNKDKIWISIFTAFTPIVCAQIFSYYLDGNLYICFTILMLSTFIVVSRASVLLENKYFWYLHIFVSCIILCNLKATGLIYAILILVTINIYGYFLASKKYINIYFLVCIIISQVFFGWHPYVQNIIYGHHIFWPIIGEGSVDILTMLDSPVYPKYLQPILSYLVPYPLNFDVLTLMPDIKIYARTDARFGACGIFFGILLIVSVYVLIKQLAKYKRSNQNIQNIMIVLSIITIMSILINPKFWFAKYVPQICLLPIFALVIIIANQDSLWRRYHRFIIGMFIINSALFLFGTLTLTLYRSYNLYEMEKFCLYHSCIMSGQDNIFRNSLQTQLNDYGISMKTGICPPSSIIWKDANIGTTSTNIVCKSTDNYGVSKK